jgi:hypothetical protein
MQLDFTQKPKEDVNYGVVYTKQIITILRAKMKEANASSSNKLTLSQLKDVFSEGYVSKQNPVIDGFARVNMFIRLYSSDSIVKEFMNQSKANVGRSFDMSSCFIPNESDIRQGIEDAKDFNGPSLKLEELYLDKPSSLIAYQDYL